MFEGVGCGLVVAVMGGGGDFIRRKQGGETTWNEISNWIVRKVKIQGNKRFIIFLILFFLKKLLLNKYRDFKYKLLEIKSMSEN